MDDKFIYFNIGWMEHYQGAKKQDNIVGGGEYVEETGHGGEVCNFLPADDGQVYGHVETISGETDRSIQVIDRLGATGRPSVDNVTVIWVATNPDETGGHIVGWYRNAKVFRQRQLHDDLDLPTKWHEIDEVESYIAVAAAEDVYLVPLEQRTLSFGSHANGRPGQTGWRVPDKNDLQQMAFLKKLKKFMVQIEGQNPDSKASSQAPLENTRGNSTAKSPYVRYVDAYEIQIHPKHNKLQKRFAKHLKKDLGVISEEDKNFVDLRYTDPKTGLVLAEIKPCTRENARFAIRTAIGQLYDYAQTEDDASKLLIVTEIKPKPKDQQLALENGFGIAFPKKTGFKIKWPK